MRGSFNQDTALGLGRSDASHFSVLGITPQLQHLLLCQAVKPIQFPSSNPGVAGAGMGLAAWTVTVKGPHQYLIDYSISRCWPI
eukprot:363900-Chlamydomonas_euryale.AAC.8